MAENNPDGSRASVVQIIESVCDKFCKNYCKYTDCGDQDELDEHCNNCPFERLM